MTEADGDSLWIVGPGRLGLALGLILLRAGAVRHLTYSGRRPAHPDHPLFRGDPAPAAYSDALALPTPLPRAVVLTVPDAQISATAAALAAAGLPAGTPVLHTSGALGPEVLAPLAAAGHPVGSLHPLVAVADPVADAGALHGAWFAVEGDPAAVSAARRWVEAVQGRVLPVRPGAKPRYHAAAVFASNYLVTLLDVAQRLMRDAGLPDEVAGEAVVELAAGAVRRASERGTEGGLTGPVSRGDASTVERHLAELSASDRALYSVLARETLALARRRGLEPGAAERLRKLLEEAS